MSQPSNPFGDRKGLLAIVIIGAFFVFWQWYMGQKYPAKVKAPITREKGESFSAEPGTGGATAAPVAKTPGKGLGDEQKSAVLKPEKTFEFNGEKISFVISNLGMGFKDFTLKNYTDREHKPVRMATSDQYKLFEVRLNSAAQPLVFEITEKGPGHFVGTAEAGGGTVVREIKYDEKKQAFENSLDFKNFKEGAVRILIPDKIQVSASKSFLFPSYDHQDFFVNHDDKNETVNFSSAKSDVTGEYKNVRIGAISSQYFTSAVMDHSDVIPDFKVSSDLGRKEALAELIYHPASADGSFHLAETFFVGPKSIDILEGIGPEFTQVINFGMLSVLAKPMLLIMKGFQTWVANWGLAIIMLTLLVRLCVFPLYMMSTRSMKAMQKVQPQIQALREKYKNDPMTMNREMMALMKENKANPLGGCLPMLLQIPIFFALFRVIGSSVELYQAPFMGWIQDLSLHDPFFILPVLMGITMYIQQKLTPNTMDPAQAKILAFMPIIFSVFMLYLPSGLTLYMFVSAVFGISQQYLIMKDTRAKTVN